MIIGAHHPATCFVCGRRPSGFGYAPSDRKPIAWACMDHLKEARMAYHFPTTALDAFEQRALQAAGEDAGEYLDGIGKTDLATLTGEQWLIFTKLLLERFGTHMRDQIDKNGAPF
jgi:hypothetical protein